MTTTRNPILLRPATEIDPRTMIDPQALALANRNAYPLVASAGRQRSDSGLAIGFGVALLLGGATFWTMSQNRTPAALAPIQQPLQPAPAAPQAAAMVAPMAAPGISISAIQGAASPAMVFDGSAAPSALTEAAPAVVAAAIPEKSAIASAPPSGNDNDQFAARVGGTEDVVTAEKLSDPASTVTQGTLITAVLETAIDTDLPGYVRAAVSRDVKSFDNATVLIPRSSRLIGQYKSGLASGQTRAYVIWTRLIRPDGVSISLGSPAVDDAGTSGLAGEVDSHFMKRFGAAALLTVIGGLSAIGNSTVMISGGQNAGTVAAQSNVQIPPTIHVAQGQPIRVFIARDLDFSTVTTTQ